ncbi:MAG: hypothetical protein M0Z68_06250 [Gammaproteobacteria bacterium]|nr:hypothetical protein [Gammaproteobacteria bacterium]
MDDIDDDMPQIEEAPAGALPPTAPAALTAQDLVLDALPKESVTDILRATHRFGVRDDDPLWVAILTLLHVDALVKTAQEAAGQIEQATAKVAPSIYDQAMKASADLKGTIDADIRKNAVDVGRATAQAIMVSVNKGAEKIQEVVADLDRIAQEKGNQFAASWRAQAARAGEEQAKTALQKAIAIRWGVVTVTIALSVVVGALLMYGTLDIEHYILPFSNHLAFVNGRPDCGFVKILGGRVCGVN